MAISSSYPKSYNQNPSAQASPLRQSSTASTTSSIYSRTPGPSVLSRTSTMSSNASIVFGESITGHRRGESDNMTAPRHKLIESDGSTTYRSVRQSLRPLPQPPSSKIPPSFASQSEFNPKHAGWKTNSYGEANKTTTTPTPGPLELSGRGYISLEQPLSSLKDPVEDIKRSENGHNGYQPTFSRPELSAMKHSATSQLRTLSKMSQDYSNETLTLSPSGPTVVGLHDRKQLKRNDSISGESKRTAGRYAATSWVSHDWIDQQRQFLQAYEYLCHIGEAKEWIEDIIRKPIPPIVQLEEALRDGVTLAEIVQALKPDCFIRIFHHPKLQFRHSDNIAVFFRFLAEIELPELFRFELVDLYEKKNTPKVIYCIHALSWLLYRNGMVDFRIGNLLGQLQFEHHELEEVQKGLETSGVSMPSFSGMSATFGVEPDIQPTELEEDRVARELLQQNHGIIELQAQLRGCLARLRLGHIMQKLWEMEDFIADLQSRIRGDWTRQVIEYRLSMRRFASRLQSSSRGFLVRNKILTDHTKLQPQKLQLVYLQSLIRGSRLRQRIVHQTQRAKLTENKITLVQAAIRGLLARNKLSKQNSEIETSMNKIEVIQGAIRGVFARQRCLQSKELLNQYKSSIVDLQATIRASKVRENVANIQNKIRSNSSSLYAFQASIRGFLTRKQLYSFRRDLKDQGATFIQCQSYIRGMITRRKNATLHEKLKTTRKQVIAFQTSARTFLKRANIRRDMLVLHESDQAIVQLQSNSRGLLYRLKTAQFINKLRSTIHELLQLQALARGLLIRSDIAYNLSQLDDEERTIEALQSVSRGMLVRMRFAEKKRYFNQNIEKIIKVQSFIRARQQGQAYKSLTSGKNPPVGTVKNFVHLLNDSDFDFDEEVEFERLRKTVVQHVRQNEIADQYITQLDIKIALLVKNKITLDEVVKHQKHFGGSIGGSFTAIDVAPTDPFDLKALNKNSRKKLEHYQELFFILQTQPHYLARLFKRIREKVTPEKECERIKHLIMGLFGYAQKRREEYYLIKLITRSIKEEIDSCHSLQDYIRGTYFWVKLFAAYSRSPKDRKFMRDLLGPIISEHIIENPECDLESDPMAIYLKAIENEQLRTGQRSSRRPNIPREEAIRDPETKGLFIAHLQDLRDIVDLIFAALEDLLHKVPYGVRYICRQMFHYLRTRFPQEEPAYLLELSGNWVWRCYLQPALMDPDKFGVLDRGVSGDQKRNLSEIVKVFGQISSAKLFGNENIFLNPLNSYVGDSIERLNEIWRLCMMAIPTRRPFIVILIFIVIDVPDAETQFDIDEFNDLYAKTKPTLYIKMADLFAVHHMVVADLAHIGNRHEDTIKDVIRELGSVKNNESELVGVSSSSDICLTLNPKLHQIEGKQCPNSNVHSAKNKDPNAEAKALFMETKRCILYIIRVQSGANLMDIMVKPITQENEYRWTCLVGDELSATSRKRGAYSDANTLVDIASLSYSELKRTALENILRLEQSGRLSRHNHYQDILNAIAIDIRTKHRRRVQRARELEGVRLTLDRLNDQAAYLEQQLKTYNDYIEQAMVTLQNKKGKKRFLMPFTKQWDHERELQRSGRVPKFGSFKYSAQELANRGILVAWQGFSERQWHQLDLTISSNEVGVFSIEGSSGSIAVPGATAHIPLDDLLQAQYNGTQYLEFFGGEKMRVNVNLFLHLIMRKFYKDRE